MTVYHTPLLDVHLNKIMYPPLHLRVTNILPMRSVTASKELICCSSLNASVVGGKSSGISRELEKLKRLSMREFNTVVNCYIYIPRVWGRWWSWP